jgi:hypothetical protein
MQHYSLLKQMVHIVTARLYRVKGAVLQSPVLDHFFSFHGQSCFFLPFCTRLQHQFTSFLHRKLQATLFLSLSLTLQNKTKIFACS